jgi:hypothetical protein
MPDEGMMMDDTWLSRDLPVLDAVVGLLEEGYFAVTVAEVAGRTGFDTKTVDRALNALEGQYIVEYRKMMTGGIPDSWYVTEVTADARRAVGQWPTAERLAERLAVAFSEAADAEQDPERKSRLRQVASFLGETGKDLAAEIMAKVILRQTGMG